MVEVFETKVRPVGNSLGVILPKELIREDKIANGETILLSVLKRQRIRESEVFATIKRARAFEREHGERVV